VIAHAPSTPVFWPCTVPPAARRCAGSQILALLLGDVLARREIVAAAEVRVALAGQDGAADRAIFPQIDPRLGNRVGRRLVEDVRLGGLFSVM
jgi:hypothetical protein